MSRTSLTRPRLNRAVWDRTATDTRLLPRSRRSASGGLPYTMSLGNPLPGDGSSIDYVRHTPSQGHCRTGAPLTGRSGFAHGEFKEPAFAGLRLRVVVPLQDPNAVTIRVIPSAHGSIGSVLPSLSSVERCCRTDKPHTETTSNLTRLLRHVWGYSRIAVDVNHPLRRIIGIDAGVVVLLLKSHGPSIASLSFPLVHFPSRDDRPVAQSVGAPSGASTPLPPPIDLNIPTPRRSPMPRGGRRPGAGAPKGNYNAFKHGRNSRRMRELAAILALVPHTRRPVEGDPQEARLASALALSAFMDRLSLHSLQLTDPAMQKLHRTVKALQPPELKRPRKTPRSWYKISATIKDHA